LPIRGEMGARYKRFGSMANRCCQFYIFLHVLCLIIEGVKFKKISDLLWVILKMWKYSKNIQNYNMLCLIVKGGRHIENFKFLMCNTINVWGKGLQIEPIIFYVILLSVGVKWFK